MSIERSVLIRLKMMVGKDGRRAIKNLGISIGGIKDAFSAVGRVAIRSGAVIAAGLAVATANAKEFNAAMAEVRTITRSGSAEFAGMNRELLQLSRDTGKAPTELAKALYQANSAGIEASKSIEFVGLSARAAIGGVATAEEAVDLFTSVLNAYNMKAEQTGRISDIVFKTVEKGKTTFPELAAGMGDVLPFSAQLNVSLEDTFAAVAALTKGGIRTANATTFLKNAFAAILKPTDSAASAAKKYGIELSANSVRSKGFIAFLQEIQEKTKGDSVALAELFPSIRGLTAVLSLAGNQSAEFASIQDALVNSLGAADAAFQTVSGSASHQFDKALNDLKVTSVEIGNQILPDVAIALRDIASWMKEIGDSKTFSETIDIGKIALRALRDMASDTAAAVKYLWDNFGGAQMQRFGRSIGDAAAWAGGAIGMESSVFLRTEGQKSYPTFQERSDFVRDLQARERARKYGGLNSGKNLAAAMNQAADQREQNIKAGIEIGLQNQNNMTPAL